MLARDVQSYLADPQGELEPQRLRELCSSLARFLALRLQDHKGWSRYYWIDDIVPKSATVLSHQLTVLGLMIWGQDEHGNEWVEPLSACLLIPKSGSNALTYQIMCGDARRGLGTTPYRTRERALEKLPEDWLFSFANNPTESTD